MTPTGDRLRQICTGTSSVLRMPLVLNSYFEQNCSSQFHLSVDALCAETLTLLTLKPGQ